MSLSVFAAKDLRPGMLIMTCMPRSVQNRRTSSVMARPLERSPVCARFDAKSISSRHPSFRSASPPVNENCVTPADAYVSISRFHSSTSISGPGFSIPANHGHEQNLHAWLQRYVISRTATDGRIVVIYRPRPLLQLHQKAQ